MPRNKQKFQQELGLALASAMADSANAAFNAGVTEDDPGSVAIKKIVAAQSAAFATSGGAKIAKVIDDYLDSLQIDMKATSNSGGTVTGFGVVKK
jgi:hypothetical protein